MEAELIEISNFLNEYPPFDALPKDTVTNVARQIEIAYFSEGKKVIEFGDHIHDLFLVRSGAVEVYRRSGELYNRLDEGAIFGQMGLLTHNKVRFPAKAIDDTLIYCIPEVLFQELYDEFDSFADFVEVEDNTRLRQAVIESNEQNDLTTSKVKTLLTHEAAYINKHQSIREAAEKMADDSESALLIIDPSIEAQDTEQNCVVGIITDRDLCTRVLAKGVCIDNEIASVMTTDVVTLDHNAYVYEAMMVMLRNQVHHLPVIKNKKPIGIVTTADIVHYESQNTLLLVNNIFVQQSVEELKDVAYQVKESFVRLVNEDANSHMIGTAMSVIGRSIKQRIIELAEASLGKPPIPYCFIALGSMGRDEQTIVTDQDNAIILDEHYQESEHGAYFAAFSTFVCDALNECGYPHCSGQIMASNPLWRMTISQWKQRFSSWIDDPKPQALLNASIFFDIDGVYGRIKWADQLSYFISRRAKSNNRFLACLARNAINRTPPLGFFKDFVMEKDGRHNNSINIKRRGTAPLTDLIRVHALAIGSTINNSFERLDEVIEANVLPEGKGEDLRDALEFISMVRIRHQAKDIENKIEADNNIEPENLSDFERRNLKDAFQILSNAQNFLKYRYNANLK
ncbi:cyclic nucleotide-binding/CBS domain-containing protein [Shewanella sp. 202IG2-18]|uniref:DUF294 nucleotidyltransferase-like domain-containing protein n=1 Tax=Parashewanella hymeniacidonis TaxID=2807618 RepID=UPI00195F69DE|nr:DUF294 nucleotidyltransferase-like domain-containing protein [Parashewanella hymeniacidonis]MBM7070646.1 cyclic nucleotide-binding/CBS domain-containing protein [Parashewanella hymeniacidonis]